MPSESVSFRISRSAQDLAETIHALSHRLVQLEQRLGTIESRLEQHTAIDPDELSGLERVGQLLDDCRQLLESGGVEAANTPDGMPESELDGELESELEDYEAA
jgi:hypothetical protein